MTIGRQSDYMSNTTTPKTNVLEKLHKKSISAKDIATQFWCEKQMELSYLYGFKTNKAMDKGSAIHQQMQVQVYRELTVEAVTWPDKMYKTAYENILTMGTLMEKGVARELKIYGAINGFLVVGQIDELRMAGGKIVIVENKTTGDRSGKMSPEYTRPHFVQALLYRKLLEELRKQLFNFQNLDAYYKLSLSSLSPTFIAGLKSIGVKDDLLSIKGIYTSMFEKMGRLPELSDDVLIHYVNRSNNEVVADLTVKYERDSLNKDLIYAMKYWNGERDASPVPETEKWKCRVCRFFGDKCLTWYQK